MKPLVASLVPKVSLAALFGAVLGLAVLLYSPGLNGPFLLDDAGNIGVLQSTEFSVEGLYYDLTHNRSGALGRPVSILSLAFTRILHGPDTWGFKYHNLLLHLLNGLLLFWLLLKLLPRLVPTVNTERVALIAGSTAALWLLHPLMVSTVLYAVQRMAQLATFFTLATLLAYVQLREQAAAERIRFYALVLAAYMPLQLLAVLSKESGALIPFYVLLIELVAWRGKTETAVARFRMLAFHAAFVVLPVLLGGAYFVTHLDRFANYAIRDFTMWERVMTQFHVVLFYLKLVLLPAISDMSLFHDGWPAVRGFDALTALLAVFWASCVAAVFLLRHKAPIFAFGLGWFLVSHLMESTVFSLELVFEHRNYLAAAGLLLVPVFYAFTLPVRVKQGLLLPLVVLPLFAFMTHARVSEWQHEELIFSMAVRDHPESVRAQTAYASILYGQGQLEEGMRHAATAVELEQDEYGSLILQILFLCGRDRADELEALLDEAIRRAGTYASTPYSLTALDKIAEQIQKGRCPEIRLPRMLSLVRAARQQADNLANPEMTGYLQRHEGIIHYFQGELAQGYENLVLAYENTQLASILVELITIELHLGSFESAEHLIGILEEDNRTRMGAETLLVEKARRLLDEARRKAGEDGSRP